MDFEISSEFIEEQKLVSQNPKKRGPYKKGDRKNRQDEVYRLHFELGYTVHYISKMMKIHRHTIESDIKFWNKKLADELFRSDPLSLFMKQIRRFEVQRTRLVKKLNDKSINYETLEKLIFEIDSRIANFVCKVFDDDDRIHKKAIEILNNNEDKKGTGMEWFTKSDITRTSKETQEKINALLAADSKTEDFD